MVIIDNEMDDPLYYNLKEAIGAYLVSIQSNQLLHHQLFCNLRLVYFSHGTYSGHKGSRNW